MPNLTGGAEETVNIDASLLEIRRFGVRDALLAKSLRVLDRTAHFEVWRALGVTRPKPELREPPPGHSAGFLDEATIRRFARDPVYDVTSEFIDGAMAAGDECHGIIVGDVLANYSWYSRTATPLDDEILLRFDPAWAYMFKAWTHPAHRGQKLNGIGVTRALDHYQAEGAKGVLSYVNASNLSSLKSSYGMGQEDLGTLYVLRARGRCFIHADAGCVRHGLSAEQAPRPIPAARPATRAASGDASHA